MLSFHPLYIVQYSFNQTNLILIKSLHLKILYVSFSFYYQHILNIINGGPCTVGDGQSQNPFRQFINQMIFGKGQQQQQAPNRMVQQDQSVQQQMQLRQQEFQQMNQHWDQLAQQFDKASLEERVAMQQIYEQEQLQYMQQQMQMDMFWQQQQHQYEADQLAQEFIFNEAYENAEQIQQNELLVKEHAQSMLEVLENDADPKFKQSKFVHFLKQINSGEIKIKEDQNIKQIVDKEGKEIVQTALERQSLEAIWQDSEQQHEKQQNLTDQYEKFWNDKIEQYEQELGNPETFEQKLEAEYLKILKSMDDQNFEDVLGDAWQKASDLQEFELYRDSTENYIFQKENPYLGSEFPLQQALQLVNSGQNVEAILALEAHIQQNAQDANAWRILGRLHQENDSDQRAVSAFLNALKYAPDELDTLSALGVSCTNTLDEVRAMNYLKHWIMKNKIYDLQIDPTIIPDNTTLHDFTTVQIQQMNEQMINIFEQAASINPKDVELLNGLAVLYFIQRRYDKSIEIFKRAIQIEPNNYQIWNKLGATLAHQGEAEQATFCYHRALDLRPNYVRVWVNLAFAYSYKRQYEDAARLYLSALTINPQAKHIWGYLQSAFTQMGRIDLINKLKFYDPKVYEMDFKITNPNDLPQPEILYREANYRYIFKMPEEEWIKQFQNN
ncbi:hypothetical protein pb186bvf_012410 [Paramecium bursaria]